MSRFHMFEVSIPHIIYAALGGFIVIFGMFSLFLREKLYIGEACLSFIFGVVIGPYGANIFNPRDWGGGDYNTSNTIVLEVTRVVLAIGVFAIGVELPKAYMARHWKSLFFLLFPVMTWGWFVSAGLIYALIPGLNFLSSLVVAACLTPTDPILAAAVVGGKYADKHVPAHLRHLLAAESACNDGAAFPFLFIALYLIIDPSTGRAISDWFIYLWLYQVILGIVFGSILGFGFRHLMKFCERKDLIDRQSYVAQYVSLAILTIGANTLLGSDDLLAAFCCGTAFAWDGFFNKQTEQAVFSSVIDLLFNIAVFIFLGAWMPFNTFTDSTLTLSVWRLVVIAILVILLRRLPIMMALYKWIPDVKTFREALFSGHFGPMGVGAIFISTLALQELPQPAIPPENQTQLLAATIQPIVAFMVLCSIAIHGLSIPFFSLGRRVHSVSRTWSRHDTFGTFSGRSLPEWTTQTRSIVPGQEVVINRDSEMERGALPSREKGEGREPVEGSANEKEEGSSSPSADSATRVDGSDIRDEPAPDGDEMVQEWQEGPHRIIERRAGPGEEVEVEVHRNAYSPEETSVDTMRLAQDSAAGVVEDLRSKIRQAPHDLETILRQTEATMGQRVDDVGDRARDVGQKAENMARQAVGMSPRSRENDEDEDEGWMSDASDGGQQRAAVSRQGRASPEKPSRSPSQRVAQAPSRRRSVRRSIIGPQGLFRSHGEDVAPATQGSQDNDSSEDGTETSHQRRSRRTPHRDSATSVPSRIRVSSRPYHTRIDSLRSGTRGSRELSPARSVRFADEHSLPATPRTPLTPSVPSTPLPASEVPSEAEDDSPRNQVHFSLPDLSERRS